MTTAAAADAEAPGWLGRDLGAVEHRAGSQHHADPATHGDHVDRLYRAALAMCVSREGAEDLVQETFLRVHQKPRWLHADGDDVGYLLRVLRNTFLGARRSTARRARPSASVDEPTPMLYQAIASLPDAFRDALIAVDVVGLSYREASRALRVRERSVAMRLHRARHRLADTLADRH